MADTTFVNGVTLTDADWFNDVNRLHYTIFGDPTTALAAAQALKLHKHGADVASAATIDLGAATGDCIDVTGTTTITAITLADGESRVVRFTGALTLTHGASLVLPGAASITTASGDYAIFRGYAAGVVRCVAYTKADGTNLVATDHIGYAGKNAVINGAFNIWQRNTSFAAIVDTQYFADRWSYGKSGAMVHTVSRSTDVPTVAAAGRLFNYSVLVDCTTADAAMAAGDICQIFTPIEGYNWVRFAQRALTLSFWVKATKTGTYCISIRNSGFDKCFVLEYTISASDTWEKKTLSISASPSAGTWDYTSGVGAYLGFTIACGSTKGSATNNTWNASNQVATSNQVIGTDSTSNDFRLTGVQLEVGTTATEFEHQPFQQELIYCQRYYEKGYEYGTFAGASVGGLGAQVFYVGSTGNGYPYGFIPFKVYKRAAPTAAVYSYTGTTSVGSDGNGSDLGAGYADVSATAQNGIRVSNQGGGTLTPAGNMVYMHWVATAEL